MSRVTGHVKEVRRQHGTVFYVKYRLADGHQVQKMLGTKHEGRSKPPAGSYTARTANEALQDILADARRGTLAGVAVRSGRTFEDACMEWLRYVEHEKQRATSTVRDYRNVARTLIAEFGADTPIEKITTERIDAYRERLLDEAKVSRRTIEKVMVLLHGLLKRAKRKGWITTNPAEDVERVHPKRSGDFNVLSPTEVQAVARHTGAQDAAIFTVAAFTGLRLGELRALRWADIDFADSNIHVRRNLPVHGDEKTPKSGKVRAVPMIDQAARVLDALSRREHFTEPDDYVFVSPTGGPFHDGDVRDEFYGALKRAGLGQLREKPDPIVLHDLRHTFGTLAIRVWDLRKVQGYMGHADVQTTMLYLHHQPKTADAAALAALVDSDVSPDVSRTAENGAQLSDTDTAR